MRKVTKEITSSFLCGSAKKEGNSYTDGQSLYLFGNKIAEHRDGGLWICSCGYVTRTTSERLNALPNVSLCINRGEFYLNGSYWDGNWTRVGDSFVVADPSKVGTAWDMTTRWVDNSGRGYYEPLLGVCGANDTGSWEDSPCPSHVAVRELNDAKSVLTKANIPSRELTLETSNVFCVHRYLIVQPINLEKARELMAAHVTSSKDTTKLIYIV